MICVVPANVPLVTLGCCWLAIRWAVMQFNSEAVLFRESERLDLRRWLIHLVRDRRDTLEARGPRCIAGPARRIIAHFSLRGLAKTVTLRAARGRDQQQRQ